MFGASWSFWRDSVSMMSRQQPTTKLWSLTGDTTRPYVLVHKTVIKLVVIKQSLQNKTKNSPMFPSIEIFFPLRAKLLSGLSTTRFAFFGGVAIVKGWLGLLESIGSFAVCEGPLSVGYFSRHDDKQTFGRETLLNWNPRACVTQLPGWAQQLFPERKTSISSHGWFFWVTMPYL